MKRQYYIDNIRWIFILILIPFHTSMAWNVWENNYIKFSESKVLSSFVIMICPYYMPLLFVLAGMSMRFALQKRSYSQFAMERIRKLFIPLLSGIVTVVALMTYLADCFHNDYPGNFFEHYSIFFGHLSDFTGYDGKFTPAHLWFMLFLLIVSFLLLLIVILQRKCIPNVTFRNWKLWQVFLLFPLPILFSLILDFGGKSVGESFALVALGYYVFSEQEIIHKIQKYSVLFLTITFISCCIYTYLFVWEGKYTSNLCVVLHEISQWCGILGFLGFGKKHLNVSNCFTKYMTANSFPIYIFHFGWILVIQYDLSKRISQTALLFMLTILGTLICTMISVEIVKRIPGVRCLFGISRKKNIA